MHSITSPLILSNNSEGDDPIFDSLFPILFEALCMCFGYSPSSAQARKTFLRAFQETATVPQPPRNVNVCYFDLVPEKGPEPKYTTVRRKSDGHDEYSRTVPISLRLMIYGPEAEDYAWMIRTMLFSDAVKAKLRQNGIVPIPEPEEPISLPEIEGTRWRKRCDLTISLRILQSFTAAGSSVLVPPQLDITHTLAP